MYIYILPKSQFGYFDPGSNVNGNLKVSLFKTIALLDLGMSSVVNNYPPKWR